MFSCVALVSFLVVQSFWCLHGEEKAGCFTVFGFIEFYGAKV